MTAIPPLIAIVISQNNWCDKCGSCLIPANRAIYSPELNYLCNTSDYIGNRFPREICSICDPNYLTLDRHMDLCEALTLQSIGIYPDPDYDGHHSFLRYKSCSGCECSLTIDFVFEYKGHWTDSYNQRGIYVKTNYEGAHFFCHQCIISFSNIKPAKQDS